RLGVVEPAPLRRFQRCRQEMYLLAVWERHSLQVRIGRPNLWHRLSGRRGWRRLLLRADGGCGDEPSSAHDHASASKCNQPSSLHGQPLCLVREYLQQIDSKSRAIPFLLAPPDLPCGRLKFSAVVEDYQRSTGNSNPCRLRRSLAIVGTFCVSAFVTSPQRGAARLPGATYARRLGSSISARSSRGCPRTRRSQPRREWHARARTSYR